MVQPLANFPPALPELESTRRASRLRLASLLHQARFEYVGGLESRK